MVTSVEEVQNMKITPFFVLYVVALMNFHLKSFVKNSLLGPTFSLLFPLKPVTRFFELQIRCAISHLKYL